MRKNVFKGVTQKIAFLLVAVMVFSIYFTPAAMASETFRENSRWNVELRRDGTLWVQGEMWRNHVSSGANLSAPYMIWDDVVTLAFDFEKLFALRVDGTLWIWHASVEWDDNRESWSIISINEREVINDIVAIYYVDKAGIPLLVTSTGSVYWMCFEDGILKPQYGGITEWDHPIERLRDVTLTGTPGTPATPDLTTASEWAREGITRAIGLGLVPQNLQSNYTQATTRAEFAALAVTLYENQRGTITGRSTFADTDDINVQKAAYIGVVMGVGNNRFDPNAQLTREQAAVMLVRLAGAIGQPFPPSAPTFADNAQVSSWAADAVGQMQATGIMGGVGNNRFAPSGDYTREQSIITILRLFDVLD